MLPCTGGKTLTREGKGEQGTTCSSILFKHAPSSLKMNLNFHTKPNESKITEKGPKQGQLYFFGEAQTGRAVASSEGGVAQAAFTFEEEEYICSYSKLQCWPSVQILFLGSKTTVVPTLKKQG